MPDKTIPNIMPLYFFFIPYPYQKSAELILTFRKILSKIYNKVDYSIDCEKTKSNLGADAS